MIDEIEESKIPRDLAIEEDKRERYKELTDEDSGSPFAGQQMSKVFMVSLGIGYDQGLQKSLDSRSGSIPWSALTKDEQWVIKSVAVKEAGDAEILKDGSQVAQIVQEYANGGFEYIDDLVRGPKDTLSTLRTEVVTMHQDHRPEAEVTDDDD
jgi:dnd system-associated protein 4